MTIRPAILSDIPAMQDIFAVARQFMIATGNPNQWHNNYPSDKFLRADIESGDSYVCFEGGEMVATFLLRGGDDPTYAYIEDGAWFNSEPYATIHRIASNGKVHGVLHAAMEFALQQYDNIRIDTHRDNRVMQQAVLKEGFRYCGIIYCWSGDERLAYQYTEPVTRCQWVNMKNPLYVRYHDQEWGVPCHDDRMLFEMLILEGFQAGLSWECVLNKREAFRAAFDNFDVQLVAQYTDLKRAELVANPNIIRNRQKIAASVPNARAYARIQEEYGSFDRYIWSFTDGQIIYEPCDFRTTSPLSDTISSDLKKRGMKFVGSTIIYSYLQAIGIINGHLPGCHQYHKTTK